MADLTVEASHMGCVWHARRRTPPRRPRSAAPWAR